MQKVVQDYILSVLECYFTSMKDYFTLTQSYQLNELCISMMDRIYALWCLKTELLTGSLI